MVVRNDIDNTSSLLAVTVTRDELKPKLDSELKKFRQSRQIPGFRPGQVPMDYVKKRFGPVIFDTALNDILAQQLSDYLRESDMKILLQPLPAENQQQYAYNLNELHPEYVVNYEVGFVPSFEVQGLDKSETFEHLTISNLEDLAEEDLKYAQKRMGQRSSPETDIQENDIVRIAAQELESADGAPKEKGWATTITLLIKNVEDGLLKSQLLAAKKGDTLRFNARQIENHEKEEMYRKYILNLDAADDRPVGDWFEGTIEEVNRVQDAELDEAFFQGHFGGGVTSKDEAIVQLKKGIEQFYDIRSNALLMRSFQERLMSLNQIELPEKFLKRWLTLTNEGNLTPEALEQQFPAFAENLRWSMLRGRIMDMYGVEVSDAEIEMEFVKRVRNYFQSAEVPDNIIQNSVVQLMQNEKDVENTRRELETDKVFEAIRAQVTVKDKPISSEEFHRIMEEVTAKAKQEQEEDALLRAAVEE